MNGKEQRQDGVGGRRNTVGVLGSHEAHSGVSVVNIGCMPILVQHRPTLSDETVHRELYRYSKTTVLPYAR